MPKPSDNSAFKRGCRRRTRRGEARYPCCKTGMAGWMIRLGCTRLVPLINLLNEHLLEAALIHCDETRLQVLHSDKAPTADHWMWVRAAGPPGKRIVLFDYDASRAGVVPRRLLEGYRGILLTDGYEAYDAVAKRLGLVHAGCFAHVRRRLTKLASEGNSVQINPHLCFDGCCEAAFRFYQQVLGGTLTVMLSYGESAMAQQVTPEWRSKIIHAALCFEGSQLAGVDLLPGTYKPPQGFFVTIGIPARDRAEAIFHALSEGGTIQMPFQKTFWTSGFGVLVDRFGIPWEVNSELGIPAPFG